ncbi:MAG: formate dehydrogenase accessory protein FdhE [Anaerolineae bacterium]
MPHPTDQFIAGLQAARQQYPQLANTIDLHLALARAQAGIALPAPPAAAVEQALAHGTPLLRLTPLSFDRGMMAQLASEICRLTAEHRPDLAESLAGVRAVLFNTPQAIEQAAARYLNDDVAPTDADPSLLRFGLPHTLRPVLPAAAPTLNLKPETWNRPICPLCGGPPDFAALISEKENTAEHGRRLLCARCDTEWGYKRGGCPFCEAAGQWSYFPDEQELYRLYVCDACRHYLKTVDWRQTFAHRNLPVERVLTAHIDAAAARAGYTLIS